jgi:hypothetical protein
MTDHAPAQGQHSSWSVLRVLVFLGAIAGTIYYIGIWHWVWSIPNDRRDGFELIGPFLGTIYFGLFVVPCWYFGIKNYALGIAAVFVLIALFFATDGAFSWFPWSIFGGTG